MLHSTPMRRSPASRLIWTGPSAWTIVGQLAQRDAASPGERDQDVADGFERIAAVFREAELDVEDISRLHRAGSRFCRRRPSRRRLDVLDVDAVAGDPLARSALIEMYGWPAMLSTTRSAVPRIRTEPGDLVGLVFEHVEVLAEELDDELGPGAGDELVDAAGDRLAEGEGHAREWSAMASRILSVSSSRVLAEVHSRRGLSMPT